MLREGDEAPDFELESHGPGDDEAGRTLRMKDLRGKRVVLYFYPKDNTPGCTRESIAFSEALARFKRAGATVIGVSKDSVKSHRGFREKHALAHILVSDPELTLHNAYGTFGEKTMYGKKVQGTIRSTFVIDELGKITRVFPAVKVDGHADAVLEAVKALGASSAVSSGAAAKKAKRGG